MAIGNIGGGGVNQTGGFQQTRENRQVQTEQRIKEATLSTTGQLSTTQIQEHQNFYNKSLGDIDGLRNGDLKSIKNLRPNDLERLFPRRTDDERIKDATDPHIFDNQGAKDVRNEYRAAADEAKRERARAEREVGRMGAGEHRMSNGDTVNIQVNEKTGERTVTTTGRDGTVKTVKYNANDAESVDVNTRHPNGSTDELHRDGTTVSRSHQNGGIGGVIGGLLGGAKTTDTYSLDANGNPVRRHTGPGADNEVVTTANADGSTDKKNLIYRDDNGRPVYEETHQDPTFMWNPRPPRFPDPDPFPFPRPHPFPEPRPFPQPIPHWPPTEPPIWREPSWWREPRGGPDFDPRLLLESGKIVPFTATVNE